MTRRLDSLTLPGLAALISVPLAGCDGATALVVELQAGPGVTGVDAVGVVLQNGDERAPMESLLPTDGTFPESFAVSLEGRTGDIWAGVIALAGDAIIGMAETRASISTGDSISRSITLHADWYVNTDLESPQLATVDGTLGGKQLAAMPDGTMLAAWELAGTGCSDACPVRGRRYDSAGRPLDPDALVLNSGSGITESPAVAAGPNGFLAAWTLTSPPGDPNVRAALIPATGGVSTVDLAITVDKDDSSPSPFALEGGWGVVWDRYEIDERHVHAALMTPTGSADGPQFQVPLDTAGASARPHAAGLAGGGFVVAWSHVSNGETHPHARGRVFDASGTATTSDIAFDGIANHSDNPRVATSPDGFAIAWQRWEPGGMQRWFVRRYSAAGAPAMPQIPVGEVAAASPLVAPPAVAVRDDGDIGVAWAQPGQAGNDVRFAIVREAGGVLSIVHGPVTVNAVTEGDQSSPSLAVRGDDFVVMWTDSSAQGQGSVRAHVIRP